MFLKSSGTTKLEIQMKKMSFNWCVAEKANYIPLPARLGREEYLLCFDGSCTWPEFWFGEGGEPPTKSLILFPPSFLLLPLPSTLPYAEACSSNIFCHSAFKHWVGTSRTWKFSTNRNVCPLFSEICERSSSEVHSFPHLLDLPQSYNMSRLFVWQTTNKNRQHKRTQKMKTVKHSHSMQGWNFQIWNAMF